MKRPLPKDSNLIPAEANRVFQGVIFDVYQWSQELYDHSHTTFEMLKRPDTVICVAIKDNEVILLEEDNPGLPRTNHFPGGRMDPGDNSWLDAIKRETKEETGYSFQNWKLVDVSQPASKIEWFCAWYIVTDIVQMTSQDLDPGERIKVITLPIDKALDKVFLTNVQESRYIPDCILSANTIEELLNIPEWGTNPDDIIYA